MNETQEKVIADLKAENARLADKLERLKSTLVLNLECWKDAERFVERRPVIEGLDRARLGAALCLGVIASDMVVRFVATEDER